MDMEVVVGDVASLDIELLQLPELSPIALKSNPHIVAELFSQWLSLPDTTRLVFFLILIICLHSLVFDSCNYAYGKD